MDTDTTADTWVSGWGATKWMWVPCTSCAIPTFFIGSYLHLTYWIISLTWCWNDSVKIASLLILCAFDLIYFAFVSTEHFFPFVSTEHCVHIIVKLLLLVSSSPIGIWQSSSSSIFYVSVIGSLMVTETQGKQLSSFSVPDFVFPTGVAIFRLDVHLN